MSFKFDYKKLEQLGYEISDDGNSLRVFAGEHAQEILQRRTLDRVYQDITERTQIDAGDAEVLVHNFINAIHNKHIWNVAVTQDEV